jgi:hypothetical protein
MIARAHMPRKACHVLLGGVLEQKGAAKRHEFLAYTGVGRSVDGELPHFNISPWIRERFNTMWKVREQNVLGRRPRFVLSRGQRATSAPEDKNLNDPYFPRFNVIDLKRSLSDAAASNSRFAKSNWCDTRLISKSSV